MINSHFFDVYVFNISKNVSVSEFITMNLFFLVVMVKIDFRSTASIIIDGGIYMNALTDIKSKIEKNKEEKRERLLASATALFAETRL